MRRSAARDFKTKRLADSTPRRPRVGSSPAAAKCVELPRTSLPLSPALRVQQERALTGKLTPLIGCERLQLTITDNRAVMVSVKRDAKHKTNRVRLHHLFADAPEDIVSALARYIELDCPDAAAQLKQYISDNEHHIREDPLPAQRDTPIRTAGKVFDLQVITDQVNQDYFGGRLSGRITWGRHMRRGQPRRSIRLGSYCLEEDLIRIHPGLDRSWVPSFYLEWVVFHEMLHALHPIPTLNGRRVFHSAAFYADERRFRHYERAHQWERNNIAALLRI